MQIYTSYFGNMKFIKQNGFQPVAISRYIPKDYTGPSFQMLAPSEELLADIKSGKITWIQYKDKFHSELLFKNIADIADGLRNIAFDYNNDRLVLCCYEQPEFHCHRHIVADFFNEFEILGGDVHELNGNDLRIQSIELF
ncbi:MAG: hypothetical protein [Wendovervirus sonii]|uniref:DUF488 domain-containing protein n=1 Tax=phage Lak_Megaphage_Sonny TaxID=3109229 RepID=A0ABZ0Z5A2_9CAUD|nr:MAG: hypothetical protein [phage Lak_Megaphage_Sonny]